MLRSTIVATTAIALTVLRAAPAIADPQHPLDNADILAVGANTTQYLADDLAIAYDDAGIGAPLDAWDAVNPATGATHDVITVRPGVAMVRRDGANEGLSAWEQGKQTGIEAVFTDRDQHADIDNSLVFLPFAQDTLAYAASAPTPSVPSALPSNAPATLTAAQLKLIYTCQATTWNDPRIGGTSPDTIHPLIPPSSSGTTTSFLFAIGGPNGSAGPCVTVAGDNDAGTVNSDIDAIEPFSVARYSTVDNDFGIQLNSSGFRYTHVLYTAILPDSTGNVPAKFQPLFGDGYGGISATSNWICGPQAQAIVLADGFTALPSDLPCGVPLPYL